MLKIVKADKDAYITNKIVKGKAQTDSNVGSAGTLDLFKIYGASFDGPIPNVEISRILIHFDLDSVKGLVSNGKIDINDESFWSKIYLKDVYGGQPTPVNFTLSVFPLSSSFEEGIGRDVVYYSDKDAANWLSSSIGTAWFGEGCELACDAQSSPGDYITSSISLASTELTQNFKKGSEDLVIDVTPLVSATLSGEIPDSGLRISFQSTHELDDKTYFVKRFASKDAYEVSMRPKLVVGFDDSITDDSQNLTFDTTCNLTLYNYVAGELSDIVSGSAQIPVVGSNCLKLKLITEVSGGYYDLLFDGSQFSLGENYVVGTYESQVLVPSSDPVVLTKLSQSGSVNFLPVWCSNDLSLAYVTGSMVTFNTPTRKSSQSVRNFYITAQNIRESYSPNSTEELVRINIFDRSNPYIKFRRLPIETPGVVVKNAYYQVRDAVTNQPIVPFDDIRNSTRISSDSSGMFFKFDPSSLTPGRTYTLDVMIHEGGTKEKFLNVSPVFRIDNEVRA